MKIDYNDLKVLITESEYLSAFVLILICYISFLFSRKIMLKFLSQIFKRTSTQIDDILIERGVFEKIPYLVPLLILYGSRSSVVIVAAAERFLLSLIALTIILTINSLINALGEIYLKSKLSKRLNIKSYLQVIKLINNILGTIIIIAFLLGKSPTLFISGLGALTAILLLVFKDTILSLVSSLQISSNRLFKTGDWIEASQFGADGNIIEIALHSVKIQNWDKTITSIPTNSLVNSSFKNWSGMTESGGRRIKRSLNIDMSTIKFCDKELLNKFMKFDLIRDYVENKLSEIEIENKNKNIKNELSVNGRSLTNIGTFRVYIECYLKDNTKIHKNMTFLVRQLTPSRNGLPLEIYVFSNDTDWANYEKIQADIFDHLLAIIPKFDLRIFQDPTGSDFQKIKS